MEDISNMSDGPLKRQMGYLSNKKPNTQTQGSLLNLEYPNEQNSVVALVEQSTLHGRYILSSTTNNSGANVQFSLANSSFIDKCYLRVKLPPCTVNQTLPRGWLYAMINSLNFIVGSSSSAASQIDTDTLVHIAMCESKTEEKSSFLWEMAGSENLGNPAQVNEAVVLLPLPWSSFGDNFALDASMLNNTIIIKVNFKSFSTVYGGSDPIPNAFLSCDLNVNQHELTDKSLGLSPLMFKQPELYFAYPYTVKQSYSTSTFAATAGQINSQNLQSFASSDLLGIIMTCQRESDLNPTVGVNSVINPFNYIEMEDFELTIGGQIYYSAPGLRLSKMYNMEGRDGIFDFQQSFINTNATGIAPFTSRPTRGGAGFIVFRISAHDSCAYGGQMLQNTPRFTNQSITIKFRLPETTTYVIKATYLYTGALSIKNGISEIIQS